jgi:hypothetical protein
VTILTTGNCCQKSRQFHLNTVEAVKQLGIDAEVKNIGDQNDIAMLGVMQNPSLIINNKIVSSGRYMNVPDLMKLIQKYI